MAELIGFLILFGALALVIGSLATGTIRIIAFSVLTALALYIGYPTVRQQLSTLFQGTPVDNITNFPTVDSPWSLIPFLLVFGALATVIGTLLTGMQRNIGYGVLAFLALLSLGGPLRDQVASIPGAFFNQSPGIQSDQQVPNNLPNQVPGPAPAGNGTVPSNIPPGGAGGTTDVVPPGSLQPGGQGQRRGLPALW